MTGARAGLTRAQRKLLADLPDAPSGALVWGAQLKAADALVTKGLARRICDSEGLSAAGYYGRTATQEMHG